MSKKQIGRLVERAKWIRMQLDEVKPLYKELDAIVLALVPMEEELGKYGVILVDNFLEKNTCFKVASVNRYQLEWSTQSKASSFSYPKAKQKSPEKREIPKQREFFKVRNRKQ